MPVSEAERLLRCTTVFAFGSMPDKRQVLAFNVLFDQPDARSRFRTLAVEGQTAGRLYALCGLLLLDSAEGNQLANVLSRQSDRVLMISSDMVTQWPTHEIVALVIRRRLAQGLRDAGRR